MPATGIYAGSAHLPGSDHTAAISIGYNPTFTDSRDAVRIEAYLLDFDRDIYGSPIRLQLNTACATNSGSTAWRHSWSSCTATSSAPRVAG